MGIDTTQPVSFDPFSSDFFDDPYPIYQRLRDEQPVYFNEHYGFYAVSRFADVVAVHRDWNTFTSTRGVDLMMMKNPDGVGDLRSMIMMDPPEHHTMRRLVSRVFTPRAVADLEPMIRQVIVDQLDTIESSRFDAVEQFAAPFPVEIISRLLGVPEADRQQLRHWVDALLDREEGGLTISEATRQAMFTFGAYVYELVVDKRAHPGDDLLSQLTMIDVIDDDGALAQLTDIEITAFAALLTGAGAETVTKLVANAVVLFHRHRDQWAQVVTDPTLVPNAIDELLRYWPPSQYQGRFSTIDSEFHGSIIPAGFPILLLTGAATRDEREFSEPDRFDIHRAPSLSIAFGHGIHACLGHALARLEARVALEEFATRYSSYELDESTCRRVHMANVAGYSSIPVNAP